jgi:hypothetical protein
MNPVLLITFNRPDNTRKVFEKIKQVKVKRLYVFNDAPRPGNTEDEKARAEIKKMLKEVNWDCELELNFSEKNLGCGWGPATAISWAFKKEDKLIILEDDCVPSFPFFDYCNHCLDKYKDDTRVWLISGRSNYEGSHFFKELDYIFSHYGHNWGWATWKRCWNHFDMAMKDFPQYIKSGGAVNILFSKKEAELFNKIHSICYMNNSELQAHAWDYQFGYAILKNDGLCIIPAKNLIENIGYVGTHYSGKTKHNILKASEEFKIHNEPFWVTTNRDYDWLHFKKHIKKVHSKPSFCKRAYRKVLRIIGLF